MSVKQPELVDITSLTPKEARILIMKDVLASIETKRLILKKGMWTSWAPYYFREIYDQEDMQLRDCLKEVDECQVCALGAIFTSAIERFNALRLDQVGSTISTGNMNPYLRQFFEKDQLVLIEIAFEEGNGAYSPMSYAGIRYRDNHPYDQIDETNPQFAEDRQVAIDAIHSIRHLDFETRMIAIATNIINNDGTFIPSKERVLG